MLDREPRVDAHLRRLPIDPRRGRGARDVHCRPIAAPTTSEWAAHASDHRRLGPIRVGGLILVLFVVAVGVTLSFSAGRSATGENTNDGNLGVWSLLVGDCFDLKGPAVDQFTEVTARPCSDPHQYELFWTGSMGAGDYPDEAEFAAFFEDRCVGAFETYVGTPWAVSLLDIYWLVPNEAGWATGDRSVQCAVYDPRNVRLTYSLKGWREPEHEAIPL